MRSNSNLVKSRLTKIKQIPHRCKKTDPKSVMELTNWKKCLGKIKSDGMTTHTCFYKEKRVEDEEDKKLVHLT